MNDYIFTGEVRVPKDGEFFEKDGEIRKCGNRFLTHLDYPIYRAVPHEQRLSAEMLLIKACEYNLQSDPYDDACAKALAAAKSAGIGGAP